MKGKYTMIIYKIENQINNKVYIGKTKYTFKKRYGYNWENNTHNDFLKIDINIYGIDNFIVDEEFDYALNIEELDQKERYWIAYYKSTDARYGYNIIGKNFTVQEYEKMERKNLLNYSVYNQDVILKAIENKKTINNYSELINIEKELERSKQKRKEELVHRRKLKEIESAKRKENNLRLKEENKKNRQLEISQKTNNNIIYRNTYKYTKLEMRNRMLLEKLTLNKDNFTKGENENKKNRPKRSRQTERERIKIQEEMKKIRERWNKNNT